MRGRASPHYGKIGVRNIDPEAYRIWLTRDDELDELQPFGFSWELVSDPDEFESLDLARRIVDATPLTEKQQRVVQMCILDNCTLREAGDELGVTQERVRQILAHALRMFRKHQAKFTGISAWELVGVNQSWRGWRAKGW